MNWVCNACCFQVGASEGPQVTLFGLASPPPADDQGGHSLQMVQLLGRPQDVGKREKQTCAVLSHRDLGLNCAQSII